MTGYVEVDYGVKLFVQDVGSGPPVLLLAGLGLHHEIWDREVRLLSEQHRVICVDLRGHGLSDRPTRGYDLDRLTRDVRTVLNALEVGRCALVGWSFGGQVAFHLAASTSELVERLVLVCSNGVRASRSERFPFGQPAADLERALVDAEVADRLRARRRTIRFGLVEPVDVHALDWLVSSSLRTPSWAAIGCYRAMIHTDLIDELPRVDMPVLQVVGTNDPALPVEGARWLQARLAEARLVELAGCGHYPMVDAPREFDAALLDFIDAPGA